jgi:hypothetical protein
MTAGGWLRRFFGARRVAAFVVLALFAPTLSFVPVFGPDAPAAAATATDEITITPAGFDPPAVIVEPGTTVLFRNDTVAPNRVTSADGSVDSGSIPPGGGFAVAFPDSAFVNVADVWGNPGLITVGSTALVGPADALAASAIPDVGFPPFSPEEIGIEPETAIILSRRRLIVGLSPTATVAEVNAALAAAGTPVIGGIAADGFLLVANPDDDFASLDDASNVLEASPAIRYAVPDAPPETTALPEAPLVGFDTGLPPSPDGWHWDSWPPVSFEFEGNGVNWSLENVRAPQVWNLREAIEDHGADVAAGVVDADIGDGHPELPLLEQPVVCSSDGAICNDDRPSGSHGTHVSGIVSSTWGNPLGFDNAGRPSLDNGSRVIGLPWGVSGDPLGSFSVVYLQSRMASLAEAGEPIRVVNQSAGAGLSSSWWAQTRQNKMCGPAPAGDDGNPVVAVLPCVPSNDDVYMAKIADLAKPFRDVVERGVDQDILYVVSASNSAREWCWTGTQLFNRWPDTSTKDSKGNPRTPDPVPTVPCSTAPVPVNGAQAGGGLKFTGVNWSGPDPNPVLVVESIGSTSGNPASLDRTWFSQIEGHVSAPGAQIYSSCRDTDLGQGTQPDLDPFHCTKSGTSMAAPLVASLALTLSRHSYEPTAQEVREAIIGWTMPTSTGGASPHIDAFSSLLSLPGAVRELVDVNDYSLDGNRRLFQDGSPDESFDGFADVAYTDRDDEIDLRDFRRYRDAWLQLCQGGAAEASCPTTVMLDGDPAHRKFDLNLDGCVVGCRQGEALYPRVDFNGDGRVSRYDGALLPIDEEGFIFASRPDVNDHPTLTDLDVLRVEFDPTEPGDWTRDDLDLLMISGELHIDAQSLFGGNRRHPSRHGRS